MALTLSQRKRLAIIEAAIVEFQLQGYQVASMDAVAKRAEVSKRTVYNHFASKEALFSELVRQLLEMGNKATQLTYNPNIAIEKQLLEFAQQEIALLQDIRFMSLSRIIMAQAMHSPEQAKKVMSDLGDQENNLERWMSDAIKANKINPVQPPYAARQFLGMIKSLAFWPQMLTATPIPNANLANQIAKDAVKMFVTHYKV
jgi:TetR/AcrR family transcriptional regulator of autoinduction and epiphytic fitness